jgi:ribosomal protein S18 acetylase RimI-like enzyme
MATIPQPGDPAAAGAAGAPAASVAVRRATPDDVELVVPLFDAYRRFYGRPSDPDRARAFLRARLVGRESVIFLALGGEDGARALGFAQLYPTFSSVRACRLWVLNDLFVEAGARGRGVARALIERSRALALGTGAEQLELSTHRDNGRARALYESLGFVADEEFVHYALDVGG